jgi:hypothetical protein
MKIHADSFRPPTARRLSRSAPVFGIAFLLLIIVLWALVARRLETMSITMAIAIAIVGVVLTRGTHLVGVDEQQDREHQLDPRSTTRVSRLMLRARRSHVSVGR